MDGTEAIRESIERNVRAVTLRPGVGQGTARTVARLQPGLACEVTDGPFSLQVGMTEKYGGTNAGPNPGVLGRAALATCMAIDYAIWAARLDIPLDALEVEVEADYDVRGELGVESEGETLRPGYHEVRYIVSVASPAPEEEVMRLLDRGDECSPYLDIFANSTPVRREVRYRRSGAPADPEVGGPVPEEETSDGAAGSGAAQKADPPEGAAD